MTASSDIPDAHQRADAAINRMPMMAGGIVIALLTNAVGITWWAATQSERLATISAQMAAIGSSVATLGKRLDDLRESVPSSRDMDMLNRAIVDHESRLREVERPRGTR